MSVGNEIDTAIARHDAAALRRIAEQADRKEAQVLLSLLADFIDDQLNKSAALKKIA